MEYKYLSSIHGPDDVKKLPEETLPVLADEIRHKLIETVSANGGHLASNLGVVELSIALHRVFDSPADSIVWDVGHQSYVHKMLTGRFDLIDTIRTPGGLSGFTRPCESKHDVFYSGHSSTSVSAAYGIAQAKKIAGSRDYTVAVIGDGAFTGGMVYEALNNAGRSDTRLIVILNDNEMSISPNVGALAKYLTVIRANPRYYRFKAKTEQTINRIPIIGVRMSQRIFNIKTTIKNLLYNSTMFEDLGFRYIGPIDGHNIARLTSALEAAKAVGIPVLLHINTVKGKGYEQAEKMPVAFHGIGKFDPETGEPPVTGESFSGQFGAFMVDAAAKNKHICAVTAAMGVGTGLEAFSKKYPDRFFDVGIAEAHATTFCSGLAKGGMLPVFAVYSSFLQRSYDQILHDAAMQKLKIVFAVDRAGFVGEDGMSHQGIYDTAYLNTIPGVTVFAPADYSEMNRAFVNAFYHTDGPAVVRYPRGKAPKMPDNYVFSSSSWDFYPAENADVLLVTYGRIYAQTDDALKRIRNPVSVLKLNIIRPIPQEAVLASLPFKKIFFFEEGQKNGGIGCAFAEALLEKKFSGSYRLTAVDDAFPMHDSVENQLHTYHLDADGMVAVLREDGIE